MHTDRTFSRSDHRWFSVFRRCMYAFCHMADYVLHLLDIAITIRSYKARCNMMCITNESYTALYSIFMCSVSISLQGFPNLFTCLGECTKTFSKSCKQVSSILLRVHL